MSSHSTFSLPQSSPCLPSYNLSSFSCLLPSVFLLLSLTFFFSRLPPPLLSKNHPFLLLLLFPPPISFQLFLIPRFWFYVRCIVTPMCEMYFKRCRVLDVVIDIAANSKEFLIHTDTHKKRRKKWHVYAALCLYLGHYLKCCNSEICVGFFFSGISEVAFLKQNPTSSERRKTGHMGVLEKSWPHKLLMCCVKILHVSALAPKWTKWRGNALREGYYREFIRDFMHEKASLIHEKNPWLIRKVHELTVSHACLNAWTIH